MSSSGKEAFFPERQHSKAEVEAVFGPKGNAALASRIHRENRGYYLSLRSQAERDGLIGRAYESPLAAHYRAKAEKDLPKTFTEQEVRARAEFSEQACREYLASKREMLADNLGNMR